MTLGPKRRSELAAIKLRGLLSERLDGAVDDAQPVGAGAAVTVDDTAWIYQPESASLGEALLWAGFKDVPNVAVVVDVEEADLTNELAGLRIDVYLADGRTLVPVQPTIAPGAQAPPIDHPLISRLLEEKLDIVAGHGLWYGEVLGLEVVRLVQGDPGIQLGVGAYDRGAFEMLSGTESPIDSLGRVVAEVRSYRRNGAAPHLMNRLVRERWLRANLCAEPSMVGLDELAAVAGPVPRPGLHEAAPDGAVGRRGAARVLAVTAVGVMPKMVPFAAALASRERVDEVLLVVPERDRHKALLAAASFLNVPASVVGVNPPWAT